MNSVKFGVGSCLLTLAIMLVMVVGEIKCIYKMVNCNWDPIGKSEIIYTMGTFTGLGCVVGYLDIEDE